MIDKSKIITLIEEKLTEDQFIVEVEVSPANQISVLIDSDKGISIDDCITISRQIEGNLDREEEDFELQVSSAGLGLPFKVFRQYVKNTGREIEVVLKDGQKLEGILKSVQETSFELETSKKEKVEGKKKKELVTRVHTIAFDDAKTVKNIIKF
ncbi:ribosome assembly cofactor RimP [Mangrovibacterium marinum]|uniref:Ribosome maturation factor RimP n=1 Tax=Mangrovibacterium marinum TaxID=1639118 RepID=A0A2T5BYK9_9BACT|nr:ribosome assembly cofactor RimP [Mangrovibacterium marinum]PTN07324.1 ribosome maturation factor RimP [Mangrovibacterium marinum]